MIRLSLSSALLNLGLRMASPEPFEYRSGCLVGHLKLPLGGARVVAVPRWNGQSVDIHIPFSEIKGDLTGGFLLSKATKMLWGPLSERIARSAREATERAGLPPDTVSVGRDTDSGLIRISMDAVNWWLGRRLSGGPRMWISRVAFESERVDLELSVASRN